MMRKYMIGLIAFGLGASGCGDTKPGAEAPGTSAVQSERTVQTTSPDYWGDWGIDLSARNLNVTPGDDFYLHVNGNWYDNFEMPADKTRYGSFNLLREKSEQQVKFIIEDLALETPDSASLGGKIGAIYNAFMDTSAIDARGLDPVLPYFETINAIDTREALAETFGKTGFSAPFGGWVGVDAKDTENHIFYVTQSGLGIGDRDYYLVESDKNTEIMTAYKAMLSQVLELAGEDNIAEQVEKIVTLETELAKAHWDRTVSRNRNLTYNKLSKDEFTELARGFPLETVLSELNIATEESFVIRQVQPTADEIAELGLNVDQVEKISGGGIARIMEIANTADLDAWQSWLKAHMLIDFSSVLPKEFDEAQFAFYGKTLSGQEQQRDRWKRAVSTVENAVGEGVGQIYVERHFPQENKDKMDALIVNLRAAMAANLEDLTWMGDTTKTQAREKLSKFTPKIGYPEKFETYAGLAVDEHAFENKIAVSTWQWNDMISDLGQPIDKTEWGMFPQTVNAYYSSTRNEIVFPAGILQPPFFNVNADPAVNYGGIGGVIGHEIGHGFDDQGSKSDGDGILRNWWTDEDLDAFKSLTGVLESQYNSFCPLDEGETCLNGAKSMGENIGDLGGLSLAYRAYQMSLNGEEAPIIDGLTGDQRFFLAWAQVWRAKYREEALRRQMLTGVHSPPYYRVNGVVRNMDAWYEAFNVTEEHALYLPPEQRIKIW